jgi:NTE family protein
VNKTLVLIFVFLSAFAFAQETQEKDIKVGLVLSGGGAKGLAHIGALKTLDSLGVKVDYVAGTSMGAIVGSLYASGYSGKQLDSIFKDLDFEKLISDDIPRESKTFYERENSEKYAVTLPIKKMKIQLPSALSRGQNVYNLFSKLMLHVSNIEDFEKLPIPFFCIATNIETGEKVVLDKGSLPQAISASGALPTLFQPVTIDGKILTDGGVVDNYPVEALRAKGMDVIIGVDVQDDLMSKEELGSATDILLQINNFRTIKDMRVKSKLTDIYIKPDITAFNLVSFDEGQQIIKNGEIAALEHIEELTELKIRQKVKVQNKVKIVPVDSIKLNAIQIKGLDKYTRSYVLGKLKLKSGEKVSYDDFNRGVNNLIATNNFDSFQYRFQPLLDGYLLTTYIKESDTKTLFRFGVHYDDLYKSAALVNLTQKRILFNNDVASLDIGLGDNIRYNFEYFIDKGFYWSIGVNSRYNTFHKNINASLFLEDSELLSEGINKIDVELSDFTNQFFVQTLFRRDFSLKIGAEHKRLNVTSETILEENSEEDKTVFEKSDYFSVFGELKFDTYDNKYFPNKGFYFDGDFQVFLSSSDYNNDFSQFSIAKGEVGYAFSLFKDLSFNIGSHAGFKIGEDSNNSLSFALGGYGNNFINNFISFYGYDYISITGDSFIKGIVNVDYELINKHHLSFAANYANVGDGIFENTEKWFNSPEFSGYALGYGIETFFGPVELKYTWSPETKDSKLFFNLGFWF